jgi:hypothetical protein
LAAKKRVGWLRREEESWVKLKEKRDTGIEIVEYW